MFKQKINYRFAFIFLLVMIVFNFLPLALWAQEPLVQCGTGEAGPSDCDWQDLVATFRRVVDFIFFYLVVPLAVITIVYAGIQVLIGRTKPGDLIKAKGALTNVALGIFLAFGAYVIVRSIIGLLPQNASGPLPQAIQQVFGQ